MKHIRTIGVVIVLFNLIIHALVQSQSSDSTNVTQPVKRSRFQIQLNGIYSILETDLRFESATGILGVKINFEENLGMDKYRIIPMINARFDVKGRLNILLCIMDSRVMPIM